MSDSAKILGVVTLGLACWVVAFAIAARCAHAQAAELSPPGRPNVGPTLTCVEPTTDAGGNPLGTAKDGKDNSLLACWAQVGPVTQWLRPTSPAGGGQHFLSEFLPEYVRSWPVQVACVCLNRIGWGAAWNGRASLCVIPMVAE